MSFRKERGNISRDFAKLLNRIDDLKEENSKLKVEIILRDKERAIRIRRKEEEGKREEVRL
jgi:hypothetical protein